MIDQINLLLIVPAVVFSLSVIVDLNWPLFRTLFPAKLLGVLRLAQGLSAFTLAYQMTLTILETYMPNQPFTIVAAHIVAAVSSVAVSVVFVRKGAKLRFEETIREKDLVTKVEESVNKIMGKVVFEIYGNVQKSLADIKDDIQEMYASASQKILEAHEHIGAYQKEIKGLLQSNYTALLQINKMLNRYDDIIKLYQEQVQKLELLNTRIEEITQLQEEYERKLESMERSAEDISEGRGARLTKLNGRASRAIGNEAQHETAKILRSMGFDVEEGYGVGQPDYILLWIGRRVAVVAHKAYSLSEKIRQRTISKKEIMTEIRFALKLGLPLVVIVTNLSNKRRWAEIIPYEKLKEFEKITTPLILSDDKPETRKICEETLLKLKEVLTR